MDLVAHQGVDFFSLKGLASNIRLFKIVMPIPFIHPSSNPDSCFFFLLLLADHHGQRPGVDIRFPTARLCRLRSLEPRTMSVRRFLAAAIIGTTFTLQSRTSSAGIIECGPGQIV